MNRRWGLAPERLAPFVNFVQLRKHDFHTHPFDPPQAPLSALCATLFGRTTRKQLRIGERVDQVGKITKRVDQVGKRSLNELIRLAQDL